MEVKVGSLRMSMLSGRVGFRDVWVFFSFTPTMFLNQKLSWEVEAYVSICQ